MLRLWMKFPRGNQANAGINDKSLINPVMMLFPGMFKSVAIGLPRPCFGVAAGSMHIAARPRRFPAYALSHALQGA
jgi:hypothetical protein